MSGEVHLLKGSDDVLLNDAVLELLDRLVGDAVRDEVLSEFDGDEYDRNAVVLAVSTISMFGDRVVVARNVGRFTTDELVPLLEYLEDPVPDADLVLVWEKAVASGSKLDKVPKKLSDAVKACGGTVSDHGLPAGKGQAMWFADHVDAASVQLTRSARDLLAGRLGEDLNRLGGVLTVLEATFGPGAGPLGPDDVECPAVGPDRRARRRVGLRRRDERAPDGAGRWTSPAPGDGDAHDPLRTDAAPRRIGHPVREGRGCAARDEGLDLPGQEGARCDGEAGFGPHCPGGAAVGRR